MNLGVFEETPPPNLETSGAATDGPGRLVPEEKLRPGVTIAALRELERCDKLPFRALALLLGPVDLTPPEGGIRPAEEVIAEEDRLDEGDLTLGNDRLTADPPLPPDTPKLLRDVWLPRLIARPNDLPPSRDEASPPE